MTVDDALKIIAQERLDVMAEGMSAEECSQIAAYVLHDAVLKDRRAMLTLRERHIAAQDEVDRLAELLRKANPSWGSPMHLNRVLAVGEPCAGKWIEGRGGRALWECRCGATEPRQCKTETANVNSPRSKLVYNKITKRIEKTRASDGLVLESFDPPILED